jgi:hypothetical protein
MKGCKSKVLSKTMHKFEGDWPIVTSVKNYEPNFIFLLTPPNSGSTAIAQVFNRSSNVAQIEKKAEAQRLIKGLYKSDRWSKEKFVDEHSIRSVWVNECFKNYKSKGAKYFIEKSPPNMMRIELLQSIFPSHILLANNRDPYANVSSMFYRYNDNIDKLSVEERKSKITGLVKTWIKRSTVLKEIIQSQNVPYLSYEKFCENPTLLQDSIDSSVFGGQIKLDFKKNLIVKDYKPHPLANFNQKQMDKLTDADIDTITSSLRVNEELLSYFGYCLVQ